MASSISPQMTAYLIGYHVAVVARALETKKTIPALPEEEPRSLGERG